MVHDPKKKPPSPGTPVRVCDTCNAREVASRLSQPMGLGTPNTDEDMVAELEALANNNSVGGRRKTRRKRRRKTKRRRRTRRRRRRRRRQR